jgi:hypothetical protein
MKNDKPTDIFSLLLNFLVYHFFLFSIFNKFQNK